MKIVRANSTWTTCPTRSGIETKAFETRYSRRAGSIDRREKKFLELSSLVNFPYRLLERGEVRSVRGIFRPAAFHQIGHLFETGDTIVIVPGLFEQR